MGFNPCVLSSLVFLTNAYTAHTTKIDNSKLMNIYCLLFIMLSLSSVINHYNSTPIKQYIDKICVYMVVLYGLYIFLYQNYSIISQAAVILLFLSSVVLYNYGKYTCTFCFDPDEEIRYYYHVLMHILASLGHHFILWLRAPFVPDC